MADDASPTALKLAERGLLPDAALRLGIRHLLRQRLNELRHGDSESAAALTQRFLATLRAAPRASRRWPRPRKRRWPRRPPAPAWPTDRTSWSWAAAGAR